MLGDLVLNLVRRLPPFLLAAVYLVVALRTGDQVSALFEMLRAPLGHLLLCLVALGSGLMMAALVERPSRAWTVLDAVLLLLPFAAIGYGFSQEPGLNHAAVLPVALSALTAAVALVAFWRISRLPPPRWGRVLLVAGISVLVWLGFYLSILAYPVAFPRAAGTLLLGLSFFGLCAVAFQIALCRPAIGVPLLVGIAASFFFNEQEHRLSIVDRTAEADPSVGRDNAFRGEVTLKETFVAWLHSRNDLSAYRQAGRAYPVFVVTAEGGGGYAAAHAYLFLSKMQRRCPNFAQHIFAIVGVSGGAVGEAQFWRDLARQGKGALNPSEPLGCAAEAGATPDDVALLSTDHLSPVVAALFFHDFANKILFGWLPGRDRSSALIASLTAEAPVGDAGNPLYFDHYWRWREDQGLRIGEAPVIMPVATNAVSGRRYVFAPFRFAYPRCRFEEVIYDLNPLTRELAAVDRGNFCQLPPEKNGAGEAVAAEPGEPEPEKPDRFLDVGLFDAAVASASFPYVTPSVLVTGWHGGSVALVDGGYLDNSGAETAREIVRDLRDTTIWPNVYKHLDVEGAESWQDPGEALVCMDGANPPYRLLRPKDDPAADVGASCTLPIRLHTITIRGEPTEQRFSKRQSFFLDPFHALVNGRSRRAETARRTLLVEHCGGFDCPPDVNASTLPTLGYLDSVIEPDAMTLPLGWHMPPSRIHGLDAVIAPGRVVEDTTPTGFFQTMSENCRSVDAIEILFDPKRWDDAIIRCS